MIETTTRRVLRRGVLRVRGDAAMEAHGEMVVRVPLGPFGRTYAYRCRGARLGDIVEVHGRVSGWTRSIVVGFGRQGYRGPLKRARLVHRG